MSSRPKHKAATMIHLLERDGPYCRYCGKMAEDFGWLDRGSLCAPGAYARGLEIDHVIPYSKGGAHTLDNFVLACTPCNARKWNKGAPLLRPPYPFRLGPLWTAHRLDVKRYWPLSQKIEAAQGELLTARARA